MSLAETDALIPETRRSEANINLKDRILKSLSNKTTSASKSRLFLRLILTRIHSFTVVVLTSLIFVSFQRLLVYKIDTLGHTLGHHKSWDRRSESLFVFAGSKRINPSSNPVPLFLSFDFALLMFLLTSGVVDELRRPLGTWFVFWGTKIWAFRELKFGLY